MNVADVTLGVCSRESTRPVCKAGLVGLWLLLGCSAWLAAAEPQVGQLPQPGTSLVRRLVAEAVHHYPLERSWNEELWVTVVQDGIDVTVAVLGNGGEPELQVDSPGSCWGEEWLLLRGDVSPGETLEIRSLEPYSAPGAYRLRVESRFPAQGIDARQRAAEVAVTEAGRLVHLGGRDAQTRALEQYRQALDGWRTLGRDREATRTLFLIGMLMRQLEQHGEGLALQRQALADWRSLADRQGEAQALMEIASAAWMLGFKDDDVEETYRQALDLWRELGDLHGQGLTFNYIGLVRARSAPHSALEPYGRALELFRRNDNVLQEGVVLNNIGGIHYLSGEPHLALEYFHQALDIHQRLGDLQQEAAVWNNIAAVHRQTGRLQDALDGYNFSLAASRQLDDRRGQGRVLNNLGLIWLGLGDAPRARDTFQQALTLRRASQDRRGESITLHNLGLAHADLEEWDQALKAWAQALALRRALGDRSGEAVTLGVMGQAAYELKNPEARRHLEDALAILQEIDRPWRQASAWWRLGQALTVGGETEEAVAMLERALKVYREIGDETGEGNVLIALARAERALAAREDAEAGHLTTAYAHATRALELLESVRTEVDSLGLRVSFLSHHDDAFELAVDLAMELHQRQPTAGWAARGLELSERARARSLLDLLGEAGAGVRRGVAPELLERQQKLLERLNAKVERRRRHLDRQKGRGASAVQLARLADEANAVLGELEEVENEIRRQSPAWAALARPRLLAASAVQALLDAETLLLEYSLGAERSFLWVVSATHLESFELPDRRTIEAAARAVYEGFRVNNPLAQRTDAAVAARLSRLLLAPVASRLSGQRLAIVADGALHYLPFAALPHPTAIGEPLLARHEIVSLPSASALGVQRQMLAGRSPAPQSLAVIADPVFGATDPRLPRAETVPITIDDIQPVHHGVAWRDMSLDRLLWSGWEAETIATHAGAEQARVVLGFDANLEAVRDGRLRDYRIVHFATHGIVDSERPELTALVLSLHDAQGRRREGFLRLPEIYNLDLGAELVVLSGCRTALGREIRGEGLVGLTRGFFAAGARRLVASLWRIQDRSAAELMNRFYRRLLQDEQAVSPAAALRAAQLELMAEPDFRDPYHWAAFAVYGDWR